ncbi:FAD/NAD-P-binding domain-containing protein [Russula earlei]|uniref:FAD/NAD-P-binding domain-containing protein n=1 Tax=Russula earlei TaxID=71964 RepID=A0ACC0U7I2_9AGAM|nr:FAD/NAD-P-binding domain-containing protein [Russula earlei]
MMELPFRGRNFSGGPNAYTHRQHRSSSSASFRHSSHPSDGSPSTRETSRKASLQLDFIIVGGGIAGLSAAYALAASGHRVQVLEQANGFKNRPGGIRLPPNATRILSHWGVENELIQQASVTASSSILDLKTGRSIGQSAWHVGLIEEMGSSFLMIHHADLLEILYRLASSAGTCVKFGVTVEAVEPPREAPPENGPISTSIAGPSSHTRPSVRLKTGEVLYADVIIGADGRRSIVRRVVTDEEEPEVTSIGLSMYTGCVPMAEVRKYAPLRQLTDAGWPIWVGDGRVVLGYPVRRHQEFAIHVWWEDQTGSTAVTRPGAHDSWDPTTSLISLRYKEKQMDPRLRFLLDKVGPVSRQPWLVLPSPDSWVDESESIMLIGDAAHPQGPGTTYGCTLALEDAATLGTLFSHLGSAEQVPTLLYAYQDLRKWRSEMLGSLEQHNADVAFSSPPRIRDGLVRWTALPSDAPEPPPGSGPTDAELAEISEVWGYYAIDAADEWWVEWGMLRERSKLTRAGIGSGR